MPMLENQQHEIFCQQVTQIGVSNAEAARRAGYAPANANRQGHRLMQIPAVRDRIKELQELNANESAVMNKKLTAFWAGVMEDEAEKMKNRLKASELIGKSLGMFIEKRVNDVDGTITIGWDTSEDTDSVSS